MSMKLEGGNKFENTKNIIDYLEPNINSCFQGVGNTNYYNFVPHNINISLFQKK